jgi:regulator of replication initiation timing
MYFWLGNVNNSVELSDEELKTRIKLLINENKMLNLKVEGLNTELSNYKGKYHKYLEVSQEWGFRVGNDRFDEFKKKVNTLLNGM